MPSSAPSRAGVEQALAVAQQHRGDVHLKLVEQPGGQHLAQELPAAGHRHVLATGGVPGQLDGPLESLGDKGEGGATLASSTSRERWVTTNTGAWNGGSSPQGTSPASNMRRPMT